MLKTLLALSLLGNLAAVGYYAKVVHSSGQTLFPRLSSKAEEVRCARFVKEQLLKSKSDHRTRESVFRGPTPVVGFENAKTVKFNLNKQLLDRELQNLPKVLQDAKAVPYVAPESSGEISGFKIVAVKPGSVYQKLGIQQGDVIKGVNGEAINSPQKAMELYQTIKKGGPVEIQLMRKGQPQNMFYQLE